MNKPTVLFMSKGFSDFNNIILWHESEDINKKKNTYFQNFSWFQFYIYKLCIITDDNFCENCSHFILKWFQLNSFGEMWFLEDSYKYMQKIPILKTLYMKSGRMPFSDHAPKAHPAS